VRSRSYTIIITPNDPDGYLVTCPALPGLVTEGDPLDGARKMAREAIEGYLASLKRDSERWPSDIPVIVEHISLEFI
jgi:predicted RNase H-like HicB family nuclease